MKMNLLQLKRIIQLTNGEADIETHEKVFLLDWMMTYKENQAKCGKKDGDQIWVTQAASWKILPENKQRWIRSIRYSAYSFATP